MAIVFRQAPILLLHITSLITNRCHPFYYSITTSHHDETTKHDRKALNNVEGSLCAAELLWRFDFTHSLPSAELSVGITIAKHMAIPRTNSNDFIIQINLTNLQQRHNNYFI